jgi:hypothetical protein
MVVERARLPSSVQRTLWPGNMAFRAFGSPYEYR